MKIKFLGFDQFQGKINIGSSRIRVDWLCKYWDEASRYNFGDDCDVMIYQKAYWIEHAKSFDGIKILDLCDPDWLDIGSKVIEMIEECDGVTTSSLKLAEQISKFTKKPVRCIPDRVDLEYHNLKKVHEGRAKSVVWYGYAHNFSALDQCIKPIVDLNLELIVISNQPYHCPSAFADKLDLTNIAWTPTTVNKDIVSGDIVINPKLSSEKFKYKSDNKTLTAWALGLPVAFNDTDLKRFMSENERVEEQKKRFNEIEEYHDVKISINEYKIFINEIKKIKECTQ